ncbi:MAG TPA: methionine biosynthesis protein MetW [Nitrospirota bacterium]|nr:methionine biosynthesis protein MetW [Nitrospirota bacterium]
MGERRDQAPPIKKAIKLPLGQVDPALVGVGLDKVAELLAGLGSASGPAREVGRWQDEVIEREVEQGSSVLDLGCNDGELLDRLMKKKNVSRAQGVELDPDAVQRCVGRGVPVIQANLDDGLRGFCDLCFDYVILEETLQTLRRPVEVLAEMLRVGRHGIVSFPNFAYWRVRLELALRGRMPVTEWLPYSWYDTPNIHLFTIQDFVEWARHAGVSVVKAYGLADGAVRELEQYDNLYAEEALMVLEKMQVKE